MKLSITHNVPKPIYFNLTKSQTCKDNSLSRGCFEAKTGKTYLPYGPDLTYNQGRRQDFAKGWADSGCEMPTPVWLGVWGRGGSGGH